MALTQTPHSNRLHITILGRCNSGKSSLINALVGQEIAIVSDKRGTTTDPVLKAMEIRGIGACLFIDTPGFDDIGELGDLRVQQTKKALEKTDIAILIWGGDDTLLAVSVLEEEKEWYAELKKRNIPIISIINKSDQRSEIERLKNAVQSCIGEEALLVSAKTSQGIEEIRTALLKKLPSDFDAQSITGSLVKENDVVLLVMPQDLQAPKGRLILPQVQTIRELLDKKCIVVSCTTDKLKETLVQLSHAPKLIITDSQVFRTVYDLKPEESLLTSFSILFANYKGDISYYVESVAAIEALTPSSKVLIAEACTHAPATEDIGRVKIPALLRKRIGEELTIDIVSGTDFPDAECLVDYDLIIHCGGCMFNRKYVLSRIERAKCKKVPMTNYGVTIAYLSGILPFISIER